MVSSTDGYCSLVSFTEGELGTPYKKMGDTPKTVGKKVDSDIEMTPLDSEKEKTAQTGSPSDREVTQKSTPKPIAVKRLDVR